MHDRLWLALDFLRVLQPWSLVTQNKNRGSLESKFGIDTSYRILCIVVTKVLVSFA